MKGVFYLLLLANAVYFAWQIWHLPPPAHSSAYSSSDARELSSPGEGNRLLLVREVAPDELHLRAVADLREEELSTAPEPVVPESTTPEPTASEPMAPESEAPETVADTRETAPDEPRPETITEQQDKKSLPAPELPVPEVAAPEPAEPTAPESEAPETIAGPPETPDEPSPTAVAGHGDEKPSPVPEPTTPEPTVGKPETKPDEPHPPAVAEQRDEKSPPVPETTALSTTVREPAAGTADTPESKKDARVCYRLGPVLKRIGIKAVGKWLERRGITTVSQRSQRREVTLHWVYLPPSRTRAEAQKQANRMKRQGIEDIYILPRGDMSNAISLGVFSKRSSMEDRLEELRKKGYDPVVGARYRMRKVTWFNVSLPADKTFPKAGFGKKFRSLEVIPTECGSGSGKTESRKK
uniref:Sporulation related domain-containing protein n=1 Tax=Candidatus Kentrum sp. FM TaxID=2126340 RepID=A0A450SNE0_9GAMM|nr:MAG: hypothetical protein BECKFM1743A_GA0114220_101323 [Candidatus Kentron sp. FM]VFJ55368.1 MAG: hypothetical protein BECKFM1743C_GA0114222_101563 [Candidatus Kentron sp. FM]VFK10412.1 MAG: hypothetical protein BECKFM1743B_GA0114221_101394 [Candidatus Kentron sp. FM]